MRETIIERPTRAEMDAAYKRLSGIACKIDGCEKRASVRGWCEMHYGRWKAHGDPLYLRANDMQRILERFWSHVDTSQDCWMWTHNRDKHGYGKFYALGRYRKAHRFSWKIAFGEIPEGMCVCHHCDNPACVNPHHLFLGTVAANIADMVRKKRHARKLDDKDVRIIRDSNQPVQALSKQFGVSKSTISSIKLRRTYRYIDDLDEVDEPNQVAELDRMADVPRGERMGGRYE